MCDIGQLMCDRHNYNCPASHIMAEGPQCVNLSAGAIRQEFYETLCFSSDFLLDHGIHKRDIFFLGKFRLILCGNLFCLFCSIL